MFLPAPLTNRSARRRANAAVLVISQDGAVSTRLKQSLHSLGYTSVSATNNHGQGLERFKSRPFSLVFFDAVPTNMLPSDFVQAIRSLDSEALLIALSAQPAIDQVFELLRCGARWFLVLPFTINILDDVLTRSVEGPPFSEGVLESDDRNAALVGMILNTLENLTTTMHHIRSFPASPQNITAVRRALEESVGLAKTFAQGGIPVLCERLVDACIHRAENAPTKLGRMRRKLQRLRDKKPARAKKGKRGSDTKARVIAERE